VVNVTKLVKRRLTDILLEEGLLKDDVLQEALNRQRASGEPLPTVLQKMGVLAEIDLARSIAKQYSLPYIDASKYKVGREVMDAIPLESLRQHHFVPLDKIGRCMLLAISNVPAIDVMETLERHTGSQFFIYVSTVSQVETVITRIEDALRPKGVPKPTVAAPGTAAIRPVQGLPSPLATAPPGTPRPQTGVFPTPPPASPRPGSFPTPPPAGPRPGSGVFPAPPKNPASSVGR